MQTLILCGGRGTRAHPHTVDVPKPLLEVAGQPVLRHVMDIYAAQGLTDFVLAAGYRHDAIAEYALGLPPAWTVTVVDTGLDTPTGSRVAACRDLLGERFFATYGDGLGDVDLGALGAFHRAHAGAATVTTVPLPSQYGTIEIGDDGRVSRFREKPVLAEHWINAGFFVFDRRVFDRWSGDDLEREVLPALGKAGELFAYRHAGFWKSLDTYKDALELTAYATASPANPEGTPPWKRSPAPASS